MSKKSRKSSPYNPSLECPKEILIDDMRKDIAEIKSDVKSLLEFKWKIMGGAGLLGIIAAFLTKLFVGK